jgi:hypothetical protein
MTPQSGSAYRYGSERTHFFTPPHTIRITRRAAMETTPTGRAKDIELELEADLSRQRDVEVQTDMEPYSLLQKDLDETRLCH